MRVLIIEDEFVIAKAVRRALEREGHDATIAESGEEGARLLESWRPDLILLDLGLPDIDGRDFARDVRSTSDVPIIMVTARDTEADRIAGLDGGADDYMIKPFSTEELMARIRALQRRITREPERSKVLRFGDLELNDEASTVTVGGQPINLRRREYEILRMLLERPGEVVTREDLARSLWGISAEQARKSIDVHMTWLRSKLGDDSKQPKFIETVRVRGFRLREPEETA